MIKVSDKQDVYSVDYAILVNYNPIFFRLIQGVKESRGHDTLRDQLLWACFGLLAKLSPSHQLIQG